MATQHHPSDYTLEPLPRRPILSAGIGFCALVILSLIILITALVSPTQEVPASWVACASMCLAYCIPCTAVLVIVIMRNITLSRQVRYILAVISTAGIIFFLTFPFLGIISLPTSDNTAVLQIAAADIAQRGDWIIVVLGSLLGLSLPVSASAKAEKPDPTPRRTHWLWGLGLTGWIGASIQLAFAIIQADSHTLVMGPVITLVSQSIASPLMIFSIAAIASTLAWGYTSFNSPRYLPYTLLYGALIFFVGGLVVTFGEILSLYNLPTLTFSSFRISSIQVLYNAILGIVAGVGLGTIDKKYDYS